MEIHQVVHTLHIDSSNVNLTFINVDAYKVQTYKGINVILLA